MEPWDNFGSNADNAVKIARNYMPDNLIDNLSTEELIEFANSTVCEVFSIKINPVRSAAINNIMENQMRLKLLPGELISINAMPNFI